MLSFIKGRRVVCYVCILYILGILTYYQVRGDIFIQLPSQLSEAEDGAELTLSGVVYDIEEKDYGQ